MKNWITKRDIILGIAILVLLFLLKCSHDSKQNIKKDLLLKNYNIEAMQDTVKHYKIKNGESVAEKTSLVTDLKGLKQYNDSLYDRINYLKKELNGRPVVYVNVGAKIVHDTIYMDKSITRINDSTYLIKFKKDTIYNPGNEKHIAGRVFIKVKDSIIDVGQCTIDRDEMIFKAEIVFTEKDKKLIASVVSKHPGFNVESIEPVVLDPNLLPEYKKLNNKRFTIGPQVGFGLSIGKTIQPAFNIGIGITYKIISF